MTSVTISTTSGSIPMVSGASEGITSGKIGAMSTPDSGETLGKRWP